MAKRTITKQNWCQMKNNPRSERNIRNDMKSLKKFSFRNCLEKSIL